MKCALIPLSLALLVTACSSDPTPVTHSLKVNVTGVEQAKVTVTDSTTKQVVFADTITGSKTFADLPKDDVLVIQGAAVNGYVTPAAQTVQLTGDQTVTLAYLAPVVTALSTRLSPGATVTLNGTVHFAEATAEATPVTVTVTGLPSSVTVTPQAVTITPDDQQIKVQLTAPASITTGVQTYTAQVVVSQGAHVIARKQTYVTVLPNSLNAPELNAYSQGAAISIGNTFWYLGNDKRFYRMARDGTVTPFVAPTSIRNSNFVGGEDGMVYLLDAALQVNPTTGESKIGHVNNTPAAASFIDAAGQGWVSFYGVYRNRYTYCDDCSTYNASELIPGSNSPTLMYPYQVTDVAGNTVWMIDYRYTSGPSLRLIRMDAQTLEQKTLLTIPVLVDPKMYVRPSGIWLSHYGAGLPRGGTLARVDAETGAVETFDVTIDGVTVLDYETKGVTDDGRYLLLVMGNTNAPQNPDQFVLYNPKTKQVEKRVVIGGEWTSRAFNVQTDRSGLLWIQGTGRGDLPGHNLYVY